MRFKREDTRLLVESWRNIVSGNISESTEEEMSTEIPMNCCGSQMTHHIDVPLADVERFCGSVEECREEIEGEYRSGSPGVLQVMGQTVRIFGDDIVSAEEHWERSKGFTISDSFAGTSSFYRR